MIMNKNYFVKSAYRSSPNLRVRQSKNTPSSWSHRPTCQRNQQRKKWTSTRLNRQLISGPSVEHGDEFRTPPKRCRC